MYCTFAEFPLVFLHCLGWYYNDPCCIGQSLRLLHNRYFIGIQIKSKTQLFHDSYQGTIGCTPACVLVQVICWDVEKKHWMLRIGQPTETVLSSHGISRICDGSLGH